MVTRPSARDIYGVGVFAKRLLVSEKSFSPGTYEEPIVFKNVEQEAPGLDEPGPYVLETVDLAYVYVPHGEKSFRCLAKVLALDASVAVEQIELSDDTVKALVAEVIREDHRGNKGTVRIDHKGRYVD